MVERMDTEGFGSCTNQGECHAVCPKEISLDLMVLHPKDRDVWTCRILALTVKYADDSYTVTTTDGADLLPKPTNKYEQLYCQGIVAERRGHFGSAGPRLCGV